MASALTFSVYFLCMYPDVLTRLREEILDTVGHSRVPDHNDLQSMKYLRAFLNGMHPKDYTLPPTYSC